jgi:hypothetical protein
MPLTAPITTLEQIVAAPAEVAFTVGEERYRWSDLILAAMRGGEWAEVEEVAARGLACQRQARAEEIVADPAARAKAAADFRYARGLVTAEEMMGWLARWGLTTEDWRAWVDRDLLRARWAATLGEIEARHLLPVDEIAAAVWVEAVCSGALPRLAQTLAGRAAALAAVREAGTPEEPVAATTGEADRLAEVAQYALGATLGVDCPERLAHLAEADEAFEVYRARVMTPAAIAAAVEARRLDWIRLDLAIARFAEESAAREAVCCVREDGVALAEIAREAGAAFTESRVLLAEAPAGLRSHLLGAEPGDLLGPLADHGALLLVAVHAKTLPDAIDPDVKQRAEAQVLEGAVRREMEARVHWRMIP